MNSFLLFQFLCFFANHLRGTSANTCNTPKQQSNGPVLVTIFDNQRQLVDFWGILCNVVKKFPKGSITIDYRPGALATGSANNIKCGSSDCKEDQAEGCKVQHYKNWNSCVLDVDRDVQAAMLCFCTQTVNQFLLDNAALRVSWKVPDASVPTVVVNQVYDPCVKFDSEADFQNYLCQVVAKKIGPC